MAKKDLVSFPIHVSSEVERLFDEMIHRPWGFCREVREWNPSVDLRKRRLLPARSRSSRPHTRGRHRGGGKWRPGFTRLSCLRANQQSRPLPYDGALIGPFMRRLELPDSVDKTQIKAAFSDGVLRVTIPKLRNPEEKRDD